jgi:hypothetical protein
MPIATKPGLRLLFDAAQMLGQAAASSRGGMLMLKVVATLLLL